MKVKILGTEYIVEERTAEEDVLLCDCDGYCDKTAKRIVISKPLPDSSLGDFDVYRKKIMRHEITHAFLFESGLWECCEHEKFGHDEMMIDWFAVQFPKMLKVFKKVGCL